MPRTRGSAGASRPAKAAAAGPPSDYVRPGRGHGSHVRVGPQLDVDRVLASDGVRIVVCCGSGGVGKTTTAAALGLRAAEQGRKVAVLTIDPARRLAQAMGVEQLDNVPRPVKLPGAAAGTLDAMMLDMKRTFDEVVEAYASREKAEQILSNPFYQALSSSFAGTQEYMAMEKLSQLQAEADRTGRWDLIVVDTPPSRSALDFLDAPERLASFLDGRLIRVLVAPTRGSLRLFTAGFSLVTAAVTKVIGGQLLRDVQTFVAALDTLFGGFRARAESTYAILKARQTAFVVVASPDGDALREASFFVERLQEDEMPLAGMVLNRVALPPLPDVSVQAALAAAERLDESDRTAAGLLRLHADRLTQVTRETALRRRFAAAHPGVATAIVTALPTDVHDLDALRVVGDLMASN